MCRRGSLSPRDLTLRAGGPITKRTAFLSCLWGQALILFRATQLIAQNSTFLL